MTPVEAAAKVRAARELITGPERWTTGAYARHRNNNPIGPLEENACRWCGLGVLRKVAGDSVCYSEMLRVTGIVEGSIAQINDGPDGHARVLAELDRIAEKLEGMGA